MVSVQAAAASPALNGFWGFFLDITVKKSNKEKKKKKAAAAAAAAVTLC